MIAFRNINYSIDGKQILKNITFEIPSGESRVIMGHSGSGKSTILRLILGLIRPDSGRILVDNQDICGVREKQMREIRKRIGMVFQDGALFDSMSVGENVGFYLFEYSKMSPEEIEEKVKQMLGFVGLADDIIDRLPDELSGGMQRRVAIGRALLSTNPKIMLYDEPTTGLDPQATENVISLINRLSQMENVTSIVVTHQITDAFQMAKRFIIISAGEVAFDGDFEQLRHSSEPRVEEFLSPFRDRISYITSFAVPSNPGDKNNS
ncbi:MAG: ATP-binding cassette domain-containing protein [candidate division Zixibacteria bacterium]|nr:ATP-binding cassette domain-containing protein [candidate division Zixibacteria bacterium]